MKWFKHYSNAKQSNKLTELFAIGGKGMYADYWLLLELLCERFDGETTEYILDRTYLKAHFGSRTHQLVLNSLSTMDQLGLISLSTRNQVYVVKTDILLLLQGKDFKYEKEKRGQNDPRLRLKIKTKTKKKKSSTTGVAPSRVMEIFNSKCQLLPSIKNISDKRQKYLKAITKYIHSEEDWTDYFQKVLASEFLVGNNDRAWRADFDWLINQNNYLKVMEGKYDTTERERVYNF